MLENQFELALALDCSPERCFSKGCTYVEHETADQPRGMSLPGFSQDQLLDASVVAFSVATVLYQWRFARKQSQTGEPP